MKNLFHSIAKVYKKKWIFITLIASAHAFAGAITLDDNLQYKKIFDRKLDMGKLEIFVSDKDNDILNSERALAIKNKVLKRHKKVPAEIQYEGKKYLAEVSLKGDLSDHWSEPTRFSLRIKLLNKSYILGMNNFSLQKLESRQYPYDYAFESYISRMGVMSPRIGFPVVYYNNVNWGKMNLEEGINADFLELRGYKSSPIIKFGNEKGWDLYIYSGKVNEGNYRLGDGRNYIRVVDGKNDTVESRYNNLVLAYLYNKIINDRHDQLFDMGSMAKSFALSKVWNSSHVLSDSNSKYYFNPYVLKLYPITSDQSVYYDKSHKTFKLKDIYKKLIGNAEFDAAVVDEINEISKNRSILAKQLNENPAMVKVDANESIIYSNIDNIILTNAYLKYDQDEFAETKYGAEDVPTFINSVYYKNGKLLIFNLTDKKITVEVYINGKPSNIPAEDLMPFDKAVLDIGSNVIPGEISLISKIGTKKKESTIELVLDEDNPYNPLIAKPNNGQLFAVTNNGCYVPVKQKIRLETPVVLDRCLKLDAGTIVEFSTEAYLIVIGNLSVVGTIDSKVRLIPYAESFKGMYFLNGVDSIIKHAEIGNTSGLTDSLLNLTGGVTVYNSNIIISDSIFNGSKAEDMLNVVNSKANLHRVTFEGGRSDAMDADTSSVKVDHSYFKNIGGDAIDVSNSELSSSHCYFSNVIDKAYSIGEQSNANVNNGNFEGVGVVLASKDGSVAKINNSKIKNYNNFGIMAYAKKPRYPISYVVANNLIFDDLNKGSNYVSLFGGAISSDGLNVGQSSFDIQHYYKSGFMKK